MKQASWIAIGVGAVAIASTLEVFYPKPMLSQAPPVQLSQRQSLLNFFGRDTEDRSRGSIGGSRGDGQVAIAPANDDDFCILTPGRNETVWHQQPLFVTQGVRDRIELKEFQPLGITPPKPVLWSHAAPTDPNSLMVAQLNGPPLQPGTRYEWLFFHPHRSEPIYRQSFTVMPAGAVRDQIAADLQQIETELAPQGVDAITQAQASYLIENDLPADALHLLFAIDAPSTSLANLRVSTTETICSFEIGL